LREVLRGTHWTLLIFSGRDGGPADSGDLIEVAHEITARFPDTVKPHLILGGFPIADSAPYSTTVLLDPMNHAHDHFGVKDACLYLIRPDLYLGFRGKLSDAPRLLEYLDRLLVSRESIRIPS